MTPFLRKILGMSWVLVFTMYALLILGVYTIESAARHLPSGGEAIAGKQAQWIFIGSVVYFATAFTDYRWIKYLALPMYVGGTILLVLGKVMGNEVHQLTFGGLNFQPAQFAIVAGFIMLAWVLQDMHKWHPLAALPIVKVAVIMILSIIPFGLVAMMGDMGSALVWMPVIGVIMLVGGVPFRYLSVITLVGLTALPILFHIVLPNFSPRGEERIEIYLDMLNERKVDTKGDAYGPYYSVMAVAKAGYKGVGYKADRTKRSLHAMGYIPKKTAHNDYVFAVFAEEQGFRGSLLLVMSFSLLLIQCIFIAYYSRDMSGQIICASVVALFFAHIFENIGMCVTLTPVTGIPLPFISYSGTFVVMCMFMLGLVQSVWIHRHGDDGEVKEEVKLSKRGKKIRIGKRRGEDRTNPNQTTQRGGA